MWTWSCRSGVPEGQPAFTDILEVIWLSAVVFVKCQMFWSAAMAVPVHDQALQRKGAHVTLTDKQVQLPLLQCNVDANFGGTYKLPAGLDD